MLKKAMSTAAKPKLNPTTFPRPPLCEPTSRALQVTWHNRPIATTSSAHWVLETHHPPTYYLPRDSLQNLTLHPSPRSSYCEWKGRATYYDVEDPENPGEVVKGRVWSYDNPSESFKGIKGCLSFYAGPWDCWVDGEKVEAQPGDFYGGWLTSDIERKGVKGAPGTLGW